MVIIIIFYTLNYFNPPIANKLQIIITNLINCISQPQSQTDISNQPIESEIKQIKKIDKDDQTKKYINLNESNIRNLNGKSTNSNRNLAQS